MTRDIIKLAQEPERRPSLPKTAEEVRAFLGRDFFSAKTDFDGQASDDDQYGVTAHDLLSAFARLADEVVQEPVAVITADRLSKMFQETDGMDKYQSGYQWRLGWNAALRQAMDYAAPQPEPTRAQKMRDAGYTRRECQHRIADARNPAIQSGYVCVDCGATFAAADHDKPRREWQGLTDEQCDAIYTALDGWAREFDPYEFGLPSHCGDGMVGGREIIRRAIEAKLREKNT